MQTESAVLPIVGALSTYLFDLRSRNMAISTPYVVLDGMLNGLSNPKKEGTRALILAGVWNFAVIFHSKLLSELTPDSTWDDFILLGMRLVNRIDSYFAVNKRPEIL